MSTRTRTPFPTPRLLLVAAVIALLAASAARAQAPLFSDDFGPAVLSAWKPSPLGLAGNWSTSPGTAAYNGGGHTQLYTGSPAWADYTVSTRFRLATGQNHPGGLRGRVNVATGRSYAAWLYPQQGVIRLFRAAAWHIDTAGLATLGESAALTIDPGVFHTLAIVFQGSAISVVYDGATVIQATDAGAAALAAGAVALDVSNQPIEFDDVAVTTNPVASTPFFGDDFASASLAGWTASPLGLLGNWSAAAGNAAYDGGGHTQIWAGDPGWTDYRVEAKFRLATGQNHPGGLRGRLDTATGAAYAAWIYPGDGVIKLFRAAAWHIDTAGLELLGQSLPLTIDPGVFHTLALVFAGDRVSVVYDGATVIQTTDAGASALAAGAVALDVSNQPIEFDDVTVGTDSTPARSLFRDDFDPATLDGRWTPSPLGRLDHWSAAAGTAAYDGTGHTQVWAGEAAWTDYRVQAKFRLENGQNYPGGLRGRLDTATGAAYAAWIYPGDGVIKLFRAAAWHVDTPGLELLAQAAVGTIDPGVFHTLAIDFSGTAIAVLYDGAAVIETADAGAAALAAGAIALDVSNQPIEFDDVVVTAPAVPPPPPDDQGPGGPILVVSAAGNPFTRYLGEILRAEGFNEFSIAELGTVDAAMLAAHDVVLLGETGLTAGQAAALADWVEAGGNLIAFRPDPQLAGLLGLTPAAGTLADGYLLVDTASGPGQGIVGETIQFHGTADLYTLSGATAVATLYSAAATATAHPAVSLRSVGASGGQAAAFAFDLARSVVLTRQGNPAWAGQERDGVPPIRSNDLFFGAAAADPRPDWIDLAKVAIPQADEQQRLLANLILRTSLDKKPLPRFWYLPRGERAAVLMTGDDHGNNGTLGRFQGYRLASPVGCDAAAWECVRGTSYIYPNTPLDPADATTFDAEGFEIGVHVNTGCADWTEASLEGFYAGQIADWAVRYPALPAPTTNRTHCIVWSDWAGQPKVEKARGIRLDTNYYYWPGSWILDRPGFMTGSGMPMRFADLDGTRIDVYQAATQMTDESGQSFPATIDALLDKALGAEGYYGVFTANMHTDSASSSGSDAIVASAQARGVPVVTARQMLAWLDGRNGSAFGALSWNGSTLAFTVTAASGADGLRAMLPASTPAGTLASLTFGGSPLAFTTETVKGIAYAVFPAATGAYEAVYAP